VPISWLSSARPDQSAMCAAATSTIRNYQTPRERRQVEVGTPEMLEAIIAAFRRERHSL